jgi:2-methylcitrate dehydratase PrpD
VQVIHDPSITARGAAHRHQVRVEVYFRDSSVERETRDAPRGSEQCFADRAQIVEKFRKLTRAAMAEDRQNALIDAVLRLDELPDSRAMIDLLSFS